MQEKSSGENYPLIFCLHPENSVIRNSAILPLIFHLYREKDEENRGEHKEGAENAMLMPEVLSTNV
jgi:hypothetical protein